MNDGLSAFRRTSSAIAINAVNLATNTPTALSKDVTSFLSNANLVKASWRTVVLLLAKKLFIYRKKNKKNYASS
jgi:hypothetical protein